MGFLDRFTTSTPQMDTTLIQRADNAHRKAKGCYQCGGDITKEVSLKPFKGTEPIKYYSCDGHYAALLAAAAGTGR